MKEEEGVFKRKKEEILERKLQMDIRSLKSEAIFNYKTAIRKILKNEEKNLGNRKNETNPDLKIKLARLYEKKGEYKSAFKLLSLAIIILEEKIEKCEDSCLIPEIYEKIGDIHMELARLKSEILDERKEGVRNLPD